MKKRNSRLQYLFKAYLSNSCSNEERKEFLHLSQMKNYRTELLDLIKDEIEKHDAAEELVYPQPDLLFNKIMRDAELREKESVRKTGTPVKIKIWWAAAAAVLLPAFVLTFLFLRNHPIRDTAEAEQRVSVDLPPGGNRAILTLSDNSTIILDTAKNGLITKQGKTSIVKLAEGQLSYNAGKEKQAELQYNTITTPRGGQYRLTLPDGTVTWLNAASSIKFPVIFTGEERKVETSGEVYFEVARNDRLPFRVYTNQMVVEALGTEFNVNSYPDEDMIKTTLVKGSVLVTRGETEVTLTPGQMVQVDPTGRISVSDDVDIDEVIAWKNELFMFDKNGIKEIMRQISRWYDVEVVFEGGLSQETFSGIVSRKSNVSQVLRIFEEAGLKFRIEEDKIIVY